MSGGVDSSVSAALLQEQGYEVIGVFIRTWQPDWIACTWRAERRDAMRVCAHLDIPFVELDLEREYKEGVADYMIAEYRRGRTPNPDVMCNREVKFGGFLKWALEHGADYVATGHYAQISTGVIARNEAISKQKKVKMLRGKDNNKDQSYFLWMLEQEQLQQILFPVGGFEKSEVRALAEKFRIPVATKKDSQGICFIGDIDMKEFLRHYIQEEEGEVLNDQGEVIGSHKGNLFYTIGERHGFTIFQKGTNDKPYYVIAKDMQKNTITVSQEPEKFQLEKTDFVLESVVDNQDIFHEGMTLEAQIRYRGEVKKVDILSYEREQKTMSIWFHEGDASIASGQSVVFYDGEVCLGGGILM